MNEVAFWLVTNFLTVTTMVVGLGLSFWFRRGWTKRTILTSLAFSLLLLVSISNAILYSPNSDAQSLQMVVGFVAPVLTTLAWGLLLWALFDPLLNPRANDSEQ